MPRESRASYMEKRNRLQAYGFFEHPFRQPFTAVGLTTNKVNPCTPATASPARSTLGSGRLSIIVSKNVIACCAVDREVTRKGGQHTALHMLEEQQSVPA